MKPFRFSLQPVLALKEQVEQTARERYAGTLRACEEAANRLQMAMPEEQTVEVLFMLKTDAASLILDTLSKMGKTEAKHAAQLTERMRLVLPPAANASRAASAK